MKLGTSYTRKVSVHPDLRVVVARAERAKEAARLGFSSADVRDYADEAARKERERLAALKGMAP